MASGHSGLSLLKHFKSFSLSHLISLQKCFHFKRKILMSSSRILYDVVLDTGRNSRAVLSGCVCREDDTVTVCSRSYSTLFTEKFMLRRQVRCFSPAPFPTKQLPAFHLHTAPPRCLTGVEHVLF